MNSRSATKETTPNSSTETKVPAIHATQNTETIAHESRSNFFT